MTDSPTATKLCPVCKRAFSNRKKWAARNQWDKIKYCSERCRRKKKTHE